MITLAIIFLLFLYFVCELVKYKRIKTLKLCIDKRCVLPGKLYNERIVFLKALILIIDFLLIIVYLLGESGSIERSQGVNAVIICIVPYLLFGALCTRDIKRVINRHNEKLEEESTE